MAAPNLLNLTTVSAKQAKLSLSGTSATVLVDNPASSGKAIMVVAVLAANDDGANSVNVTLSHHSAANGAGTAFKLAHLLPVAATKTLVLIDKATPVILEEDQSLVVTASAANDLDVTAYYFELS
jgi:hypothetical protein